MADSAPASLALWRANSLVELGEIAANGRLHDALAQPIKRLLEKELGPDAADAVRSIPGVKGSMTLGQFLAARGLQQELRRLVSPAHRRELLRAARAMLERPRPVARPPEPTPSPEPVSEEQARLPGNHEGLEKWANGSGVSEMLRAPVQVLEDSLDPRLLARARAQGGSALTIGDLVAMDGYPFRAGWGELHKLRPAACAYLLARAADVRKGLEEERALESSPRPRPEHPLLRELQNRLTELRARVRAQAMPRSAQTRSKGDLSFRGEPPSFTYVEPGAFLPAGQWRFVPPNVTILLEGWRDAPLHGACACRPDQVDGCTHVLAAIDLATLFLSAPAPDVAARIVEELSLPRWGRALRALASPPKGEVSASRRLTWRVKPQEYGLMQITPYLQKESKRGAYTSGSRVSSEELLWGGGESLSRADLRAAALLGRRGQDRDGAWLVLQQLVGHPHVFLDDQGLSPLAVAEAELGLSCEERGGAFELVAAIDGVLAPDDLVARLAAGRTGGAAWLDKERGRCLLVRAPRKVLDALATLEHFGRVFPAEASEQLVEKLDGSGLPVELPAALCGSEHPPCAAPMVYLSPFEALSLVAEARVRALPGAPLLPAGSGPSRIRGKVDGSRVFAHRDLDAERRAACELWSKLGLPVEEGSPVTSAVEGHAALDLLVRLEQLAKEGLEVHWPPKKPAVSRPARTRDVRLAVREGRDWFGLAGGAEVDGERVELALLLESARRKERYVKLSEERFLALSDELASRLQPLADQVFVGRHGPEVGPAAAPLLDELAGDVAELEACQSFRALAERFRAARDSRPEVPPELLASLRDYQREGFRWLVRLSEWGMGACLADDMGLGKTLEALALLVHRRALGPALVVAPTSVCFNWQKEAERFAPCLRLLSYREANREQVLGSLGPGDVVVASYGLVTRDVERFKAVKLSTLVIDEAQAIKNAQTRRARALRDLDAAYRVALTGTPVENHVGELWSLFRILIPGLLGSAEQFRDRFGLPIETEKTPARRQALSRLLRPFLLRRTKHEVARELPPRTEVMVPVALSAEERRLYEDARLAAVAELSGESSDRPGHKRFQVLAALTRLRLLACHPRLHDVKWDGPASKLERLLSLVTELKEEGHRALVFSQFTRHLAVVREAFDASRIRYQYLDGQTPEAERRRAVEAFQAGEGDVFLISLKAGGTGLNLTGADNVIHLDPWWNPAVEDQATDRAHRIGQSRPVTVYRLVTKGTIEEAILKLHAEKRDLVAGLLEGTGSAAKLDTEELAALLEAGARLDSEEDTPSDAPEPTDAGASSEQRFVASARARVGDAANAQVAEPPAGGVWIPRVLGDRGAIEVLADEFQSFLLREHAAGRVGHGPVKSYARAVGRFGEFVLRDQGKRLRADMDLEAVRAVYLEELEAGRHVAPKSEPILARSALAKLAAFLGTKASS